VRRGKERSVRARSFFAVGVSLVVVGCGWDPAKPFEREAPEVNQAIRALDGGDATVASSTLEDYLSTGPCAEGNIGTPEPVKKRPNGGFDLGLSLFKIGETFGHRFGEEELDGGLDEKMKALRGEQIACALRVLSAIESYGASLSSAERSSHPDEGVPADLLARVRYLEGNLNFLDGHYEEAVSAYDKALALTPGESDGGDPVGRDAAWNRAIAMRRVEDKKDAGNDSGSDGGKDGGGDSGNDRKDSGSDSGNDGKDSGNDSGSDSGPNADAAGNDAAQPPPDNPPDAGPPPPPRANEDDRMLDQLESAPTVQQEAAKKMASHHKVRGMADK
jgi:tetratricopeptide (TPR) repeat protein